MSSKKSIIVKTFTWSRDSHGLYDYETKQVMKKTFKTNCTSRILRDGNDCILLNEQSVMDEHENCLPLASIQEHGNDFFVCMETDFTHSGGKLWLVVKQVKSPSRGWKLNEGDIVKLGRVKFRVKEINTGENGRDEFPKQLPTNNTMAPEIVEVASPQREDQSSSDFNSPSKQIVCRYDWTSDQTAENPLISPCKCTGSVKYVHVECLQQWIKSKIQTRQNGSAISYSWKPIACELWQEYFPNTILVDNKVIDLVNIPTPETPHMILESISRDRSSSRSVHVVSAIENVPVKIGRGHDTDIRISDISVSRQHAQIRFVKGSFSIEDNDSKFGTLIQVKKPIFLTSDTPISIQVSRSVIQFQLKLPFSLIPACFRSCCKSDDKSADVPEIFNQSYDDADSSITNPAVQETPEVEEEEQDFPEPVEVFEEQEQFVELLEEDDDEIPEEVKTPEGEDQETIIEESKDQGSFQEDQETYAEDFLPQQHRYQSRLEELKEESKVPPPPPQVSVIPVIPTSLDTPNILDELEFIPKDMGDERLFQETKECIPYDLAVETMDMQDFIEKPTLDMDDTITPISTFRQRKSPTPVLGDKDEIDLMMPEAQHLEIATPVKEEFQHQIKEEKTEAPEVVELDEQSLGMPSIDSVGSDESYNEAQNVELTLQNEAIDEGITENPIIPSTQQLEEISNSGILNSVSQDECEDNEP